MHVCPTGIDIRNGTQYECIGCAACIDACDAIMEEVGYPKGLVRYDTEEGLAGRRTRVLRPRLVGYGAMLAVMITLFGVALWHRVPLAVDVLRDRARLYRETTDGIENVYTLKIMNKDQRAHTYAISVEPADVFALDGPAQVEVAAGGIRDVPVRVRRPERSDQPPAAPVTFTVRTSRSRTGRRRARGEPLPRPGSSEELSACWRAARSSGRPGIASSGRGS